MVQKGVTMSKNVGEKYLLEACCHAVIALSILSSACMPCMMVSKVDHDNHPDGVLARKLQAYALHVTSGLYRQA